MKVSLRRERRLINRLPSIESSPACVLPRAERNETLQLPLRPSPPALPLFSHLVRHHYLLLLTEQQPLTLSETNTLNITISHVFLSSSSQDATHKNAKNPTMWHDSSQKVADVRERRVRYKPRGTTRARSDPKIRTTEYTWERNLIWNQTIASLNWLPAWREHSGPQPDRSPAPSFRYLTFKRRASSQTMIARTAALPTNPTLLLILRQLKVDTAEKKESD